MNLQEIREEIAELQDILELNNRLPDVGQLIVEVFTVSNDLYNIACNFERANDNGDKKIIEKVKDDLNKTIERLELLKNDLDLALKIKS